MAKFTVALSRLFKALPGEISTTVQSHYFEKFEKMGYIIVKEKDNGINLSLTENGKNFLESAKRKSARKLSLKETQVILNIYAESVTFPRKDEVEVFKELHAKGYLYPILDRSPANLSKYAVSYKGKNIVCKLINLVKPRI